MKIGEEYRIRQLCEDDKVNCLKLGDPKFLALKTFLQKHALEFHRQGVAKTYVAVRLKPQSGELVEDLDSCVLGYVTVTCSEIDLKGGGELLADCPEALKYELPALKIARLAVDSRLRGEGIGEELVNLAIAIAIDVIAPVAGCRFVVTDAKADAIEFYKKQDFTLLDTEENLQHETPVMFLDLLHLDKKSVC